jgi:hypothetical protein
MSWPAFQPDAYTPGERYVVMSLEAYQRIAEFVFLYVDDLGICQVDVIAADGKRHSGAVIPLPEPGESRANLRNTSFCKDVIILDDTMSILPLREAQDKEAYAQAVEELSPDNVAYLSWVEAGLQNEGRLESISA